MSAVEKTCILNLKAALEIAVNALKICERNKISDDIAPEALKKIETIMDIGLMNLALANQNAHQPALSEDDVELLTGAVNVAHFPNPSDSPAKKAMREKSYTDCNEVLSRLAVRPTDDAVRDDLAEVDALIDDYGIDTVGTGNLPTKKEQARVNTIIEKVLERVRIRKSPTTKGDKG